MATKIKIAFSFILCKVLISGIVVPVSAQEHVLFEFLPGGAVAFGSPLIIHQDGYPDLSFTACYRTEPFKLPLHYSVRVGYHFNKPWGIELEFNHLKIILDNTSDEIKHFSITHGFNQFWVNYLRSAWGFDFRAGLGLVLAHPESIIRDQKFDEFEGIAKSGYHISGITGQLAAQKQFYIGRHFFFSAEVKLNQAYAKVPVSNGYAKVWASDVQGLVGIGFAL